MKVYCEQKFLTYKLDTISEDQINVSENQFSLCNFRSNIEIEFCFKNVAETPNGRYKNQPKNIKYMN